MADRPDWEFEEEDEKDDWWRKSPGDDKSDGEDLHFDSEEEKDDFEKMYARFLESKEEEESQSGSVDELDVYLESAANQEPGTCVRVPEGTLSCRNLSMYYWNSHLDGPIALHTN